MMMYSILTTYPNVGLYDDVFHLDILTIWKCQHTDNQKEEDEPAETNPEVIVFIIIIPEIY